MGTDNDERRSTTTLVGFICVLIAIATPPVAAQQQPQTPAVDTVTVDEPPFSPRGAFFRSLVLPGWGQAYVGAPGRGAVYFSLVSGSLWMSYVARRQQNDARAEQEWLRRSGELEQDEESGIFAARSQQFEDWAALSVFLFFFSGADAYVSAYLADFDERIGVFPGSDGTLEIRSSFPIGGRR